MIIFSAAVTLALEVQGSAEPNPRFVAEVTRSKQFLQEVQHHNKLASEALLMLDELFPS